MTGSKISKGILRLAGWSIEGDISPEIRKCVLAAAPHTSAIDFPIGLLVRSAIGRQIKFMGKRSLFDGPFGFIFKWLGGHPVDRSKSKNLVDQYVDLFKEHDDFAVVIAPEGTRRKVNKFKTGFYHIARLAGVPIILTGFDYGRKVVSFSKPFYPGVDQAKDLEYIWNYFKTMKGKHPELGIQ
jgi:1-acyl-sn-glycerol-3-phosphate acyltransferase